MISHDLKIALHRMAFSKWPWTRNPSQPNKPHYRQLHQNSRVWYRLDNTVLIKKRVYHLPSNIPSLAPDFINHKKYPVNSFYVINGYAPYLSIIYQDSQFDHIFQSYGYGYELDKFWTDNLMENPLKQLLPIQLTSIESFWWGFRFQCLLFFHTIAAYCCSLFGSPPYEKFKCKSKSFKATIRSFSHLFILSKGTKIIKNRLFPKQSKTVFFSMDSLIKRLTYFRRGLDPTFDFRRFQWESDGD